MADATEGSPVGFEIKAVTEATPVTDVTDNILMAEPGDVLFTTILPDGRRTIVFSADAAHLIAQTLMTESYTAMRAKFGPSATIADQPRASDR